MLKNPNIGDTGPLNTCSTRKISVFEAKTVRLANVAQIELFESDFICDGAECNGRSSCDVRLGTDRSYSVSQHFAQHEAFVLTMKFNQELYIYIDGTLI